jgi:hypothetical protein
MDSLLPRTLLVAALWLAACNASGTPESARPAQSTPGAGMSGGAAGTASGVGGGGAAAGVGAGSAAP